MSIRASTDEELQRPTNAVVGGLTPAKSQDIKVLREDAAKESEDTDPTAENTTVADLKRSGESTTTCAEKGAPSPRTLERLESLDTLCRLFPQRAQASRNGTRVPSLEEFLSFETYIFDCDGVIWGIDEEDTRTSVQTINYLLDLGKSVMFITNNSNKTRADFVKQLEGKNVNFGERSEEEKLRLCISASYTTAVYLQQSGLQVPFVITSATGILEELRLAGITRYYATIEDDGTPSPEFAGSALSGGDAEVADIIDKHAGVDCIVVGWDMSLTARKVATAINYIRWHEDLHGHEDGYEAMPLIACSGDAGGVLGTVKHQGQSVKLRAIGNGAMADIVARSFDPPLEWLDMGKPSDALLEMLRSPCGYDVDLSTALMVGDTLQTDIVFGNRGGMATLLVMTGVTTRTELQQALSHCTIFLRRPRFVLPQLGFFAEAQLLKPTESKKDSRAAGAEGGASSSGHPY